MKKTISYLALLLTLNAFAQNRFEQFSIEADYGFSYSRNPQLSQFNHLGIGFRYMTNEYWGAKIDYGSDHFDSDTQHTGSHYQRISLQAVYNVGRALNINYATGGTLNFLLHAGVGYSSLQSDIARDNDNIGNFIAGGTAQVYLTDYVALTGDVSGILNFRQQTGYDGIYTGDTFTGKMLTASIGLTIYFGRNASRADWR